jgi:hypothetical protein
MTVLWSMGYTPVIDALTAVPDGVLGMLFGVAFATVRPLER